MYQIITWLALIGFFIITLSCDLEFFFLIGPFSSLIKWHSKYKKISVNSSVVSTTCQKVWSTNGGFMPVQNFPNFLLEKVKMENVPGKMVQRKEFENFNDTTKKLFKWLKNFLENHISDGKDTYCKLINTNCQILENASRNFSEISVFRVISKTGSLKNSSISLISKIWVFQSKFL